MTKPNVFILHRTGYTYDGESLKAKYGDVAIQFSEYPDERLMVDTFW
jgi:hypothetical protein